MRHEFNSLATERLLIRRFHAADVEPFLRYRSDPAVIRFQEWTEVAREDVLSFVSVLDLTEPGVPGQAFQFAVEHKADRIVIGDMALHLDVKTSRSAEIGYTLSPPYQHQGYGYEMVSALLDYAFASLGLHRIYARVLGENAASINLLQRLQFRQEGELLEQIWFNGAWHDQMIFGILEWERETGNEED